MGPPLNVIWPRRPPQYIRQNNTSDNTSEIDICSNRKSFLANAVDNLRCVYLNFTLVLILLQVIFSLSVCVAGPVLLSPEYMRGHVTLARNIRHLPCISRRSGQEGVCMFAIDCLKANGSHLGTCIDRFYFGSCCQMPDKTILPQIVGNNIEDNSIESSNFVHPQGEDKISENVSKIPDIFPTRKPSTTTEKAEKETEQNDQKTTPAIKADGATDSVESKTETTSLDENKVADEEAKITTETYVEVNKVDKDKPATKTPEIFTEIPIKLSTFQSVSVESNNLVTETSVKVTEATSEVPKLTTITTISTQAETTTVKARPQTTRKPIRPTYKPRPTYRPNNSTKPQYSTTNLNRPKPIKPINVFNSTRKPPYRPPPKRPSSTKKPLPIPPRLNITILPQLPNTRPTFNKPVVPSIMYINTTTTSTTTQEALTSTTSTTTTSAPTTTSTAAPTSSSEPATTEREEPSSSPIPTTVAEEKEEIPTTLAEKETTITEEVVDKTTEEVATEKLTVKPTTEVEVSTTESVQSTSSTEFPPGLVTWSNTVDSATKAPEKTQEPNATESEEIWSPITPPEGWILISTIPPKPETTISSSTTESVPQETPPQSSQTEELETTLDNETSPTTVATSPSFITTEKTVTETIADETAPSSEEAISSSSPITTTSTEAVTTTEIPTTLQDEKPTTILDLASASPIPSPQTTISSTIVDVTTSPSPVEKVTTTTEKITSTTEQQIHEFVVNVTLTPMATLATEAVTTVSPVTENVTVSLVTVGGNYSEGSQAINGTEQSSLSTEPSSPVTEPIPETTTESYNMSNYNEVCGRRIWPEARIVGGAKSGFGKWPWQISLRQWRTSTYLHKCGAALLNQNWAITAAHCVEHVPPSELLVRLGEHDLANESEPYGFAERRVQLVASHPHFDPATFEYDLALLRFYEPVTFQPNILPVCVPDDDDNYVGKTAYVTGWGRLYDEGPLPSVLQEVEVPVINNSACEGMYQAAGYNEHIPNIFICAGLRKGGADSCEGDSGGPMVVQRDRDHRFVLGGVISWGIGCAEPNQPGVYTRISEFRDWINQILQF